MKVARIRSIAISVLATVWVFALLPSAQAQTPLSPSRVANNIGKFQNELSDLLNSYFSQYGNRLSTEEQKKMTKLVQQVDNDLEALENKAKMSATLSHRQVSQEKIDSATRSAARLFDTTYRHAIAALNQVQPILQPKLSFMEALTAKSDLDRSLQQFQVVGTQLHALAEN